MHTGHAYPSLLYTQKEELTQWGAVKEETKVLTVYCRDSCRESELRMALNFLPITTTTMHDCANVNNSRAMHVCMHQ